MSSPRSSRRRRRSLATIAKFPGYEAGSQERPHVPCVHCGYMHELEWTNFHFEDPDRPYFVCPACGGVIEERHRQQMLEGFQWVAMNPAAAKTHRSFRIWSAYSVLQSWSRIAAEWIRAQGDGAAEQVFCTDVLGRAYEVKGDARPPAELAARAAQSHYSFAGQVPEGCPAPLSRRGLSVGQGKMGVARFRRGLSSVRDRHR